MTDNGRVTSSNDHEIYQHYCVAASKQYIRVHVLSGDRVIRSWYDNPQSALRPVFTVAQRARLVYAKCLYV